MQRSYDIRPSACAIGAEAKWLDNLLTRHPLPGVSRGRQGIQRRVSHEGLLSIELARILNQELGVSVAQAVRMATAVIQSEAEGRVAIPVTPAISLVVDLRALHEHLRSRIVHAMESVGPVRRGRPRKTA